MLVPNLAVVLLLVGPTPGPEPSASSLVERLGSPRYAERERAAADLRDLGAAALPALRAARRAGDAEVRARAAALLDRIEAELMVRPTLVALDFRDRPLAEVARALGQRAGMALLPEDPDDQDLWQGRRVSLEEPGPVPFWSALDKLCAAGGLRYGPGPDASGISGAGLLLSPRSRPPGPASDSGPFRVKLVQLHYERNRTFEGDEGGPVEKDVAVDFHAQFQVWGEPRLLIGQAGALEVAEAVDDRGRSLVATPPGPAPEEEALDDSYDDQPLGQGVVQVQAALSYLDPPSRSIRRLRGSLPLAVAARRADPTVVPLAGPAGRAFGEGDLRLTLLEVKRDPDSATTSIELALRPGRDPDAPAPPPRDEVPAVAAVATLEERIEVVDAMGRPIPWSLSSQDVRGDGARVTLLVAHAEEVGPPDRLRLYGLTRTVARVPFEFHDVRMP